MEISTNPKDYGLNARVILQLIDDNHVAIVKKRKSRIIMKDGIQILSQVGKITNAHPNCVVSLVVSGPVCSKTTKVLKDSGVNVIKEI